MNITSKQIIKEIGCQYLNIYRGEGYWYFEYDDLANNVYHTRSVMSQKLNQMTLEQWVEDGKDFVQDYAVGLFRAQCMLSKGTK